MSASALLERGEVQADLPPALKRHIEHYKLPVIDEESVKQFQKRLQDEARQVEELYFRRVMMCFVALLCGMLLVLLGSISALGETSTLVGVGTVVVVGSGCVGAYFLRRQKEHDARWWQVSYEGYSYYDVPVSVEDRADRLQHYIPSAALHIEAFGTENKDRARLLAVTYRDAKVYIAAWEDPKSEIKL